MEVDESLSILYSISISWYLDHLEKENLLFNSSWWENENKVFIDDLGWIDGLREASFYILLSKAFHFLIMRENKPQEGAKILASLTNSYARYKIGSLSLMGIDKSKKQ